MNKVKKYIKAENYFCFLALLEMILVDAFDLELFDQYRLAEVFGITIPKNELCMIKNITYSDSVYEYGVHIHENKLNAFFQETGLPMHVEYFIANPYEANPIDAYENNKLREGKYIVYTYSYGSLYHEPQNKEVGHVAILEEVISERTLKIYDPGPRNYGVKKVDRIGMYEAMLERNAGLYVFEKL